MLKDKNIICISSIDWDFIWQGHQEIMSRLAKEGNRILYVENTGVRAPKIKDAARIRNRIKNWQRGLGGFREVEPNLFVFSPLVIPFPYSRCAQFINTIFLLRLIKRWMESASFYDPVIWTFIPTVLTVNLIKQIKNRCVIYYCIDSFKDSSDGAKRIVKSEEELFRLADLVFVTSHSLKDRAGNFNSNVYFFPFAVNLEEFERVNNKYDNLTVPDEMKDLKRPIIGYVGGIHRWIDRDLLTEVAEKRPEWTFVLIGPEQSDTALLKKCKNILFLGRKPHKELPLLIHAFDVCIIPYLITGYTNSVYPTKLTEYLICGKPVIGTPIKELKIYDKKYPGMIELAENMSGFINAVERSVQRTDENERERRVELARENSWDGHLKNMSSLINDTVEKKGKNPLSWQEQFSSFYKDKTSSFAAYASLALVLWVLFFHSSFLWWLADGLIIESPLRYADAIVAFGGGVGESGEAGQGYIERSKKAIDLYNKGMAKDVLFISGFIYMLKEAEMMKALGVEYGIPKEKILINTTASNVYYYVRDTLSLAKKKGWKRIMVISSPYNMLRVKLCFDSLKDSKIDILFVPVEHSNFYDWPKKVKTFSLKRQITLIQLKGLFHELIAIGYYMLKGYI